MGEKISSYVKQTFTSHHVGFGVEYSILDDKFDPELVELNTFMFSLVASEPVGGGDGVNCVCNKKKNKKTLLTKQQIKDLCVTKFQIT